MTIDEPGYFERLARVESGHWWSRAMWRLASGWLSGAIRGRRGLVALDLGCGAGLTMIRLAGLPEVARVIGLEPDPGALRLAARHRGFDLIRGSATAVPLGPGSVDVVTCFDVFQHLPGGGDRAASAEIARVLRPGGVAVVRSNASGFGPGRSSGGPAYRLGELVGAIAGPGLEIRRASYANGLPALGQEVRGRLRMLAGERGRSWRAHPSGGGLRVDVPSPAINRWMGRVAGLERAAMGALGVPLPFGPQHDGPGGTDGGRAMRIGIDGACLANRRGFGRFARQVVQALAEAGSPHEFVAFVDRPSLESVTIPGGMEAVAVDVAEAPSRAASASGRRRVGDMLAMGRAVARAGLDVIYFPASYSFFPVWNAGRVVVTMHDTLALAHPEWVFPNWRGKVAWRAKEQAAALWADRIVTVSEAARRDLLAWFRLPEGRVKVVSEGPDAAFHPLEPGPASDAALRRLGVEPGSRYLLYVGGLSPHKNLIRLIEAFARGTDAASDARLILVGDLGDVFHTHVPALREAIDRAGLGDRVHLTGFVPDADLAHLYRRAYALAQPSLMEGFGLPPVEAMACGTPILCSTAGSLPEVVGEAGIYFDPTDVPAMARAIGNLLANPDARDLLAGLALGRAARFTWASAARTLLECFEELAPGRGASLGRTA